MDEVFNLVLVVAALGTVVVARNVCEWSYKKIYKASDWAVEARWSRHKFEGDERVTYSRSILVRDADNRIVLHPNRRLAAAEAEKWQGHDYKDHHRIPEYSAVEYRPDDKHAEEVRHYGWFGQALN